ncbi:MAG: tRNA lysidine(34) synthetase TilS [Rhodospirillales bacterium]|nr:tRNA lysidine(34) synthetase TilS [Rhodospirillales bacterium]
MPDRERRFEAIAAAEFERLMVSFDVKPAERVAVAVSGGADSLALTLLLADWAAARDCEIVALTVDHGLRAGSKTEALQVASWLRDAGVEHHILNWQGGNAGMPGMQARARDARYGLMAGWCRAHGVRQLFVAHHLGDQAETFVMRLKRASTLFGLAAMASKRERYGIWLCRPLLAVPKTRLVAMLDQRGQKWVEDPSNLNCAFERVRTRALIAKLQDEGVTPERLAGAARAAGRVTEILDRAASAFEAAAVEPHLDHGFEGGFDVDRAAFQALPQALRERVLSRLLRSLGAQVYAPSPAKLERLALWMGGNVAGGAARTLGGYVVRRGKMAFTIVPEPSRKSPLRAKKPGFFACAPLPQVGKRLTSQVLGSALAQTKC